MNLRNTLMVASFVGVFGLSPSLAWAECARAYTGPELVNDLSAMSAALRKLDEDTFKISGANLEKNLPCMRTQVQPQVFASAYRMIGAYEFLAGDRSKAAVWFRSSLELEPGFEWDVSEFPFEHPIRAAFNGERAIAGGDKMAIPGKVINEPAGSKLFLDGRALTKAAATPGRPHILQVIAEDRTVRQVFLIDGNAIPEQFLRDEGTATPVAASGKKGGKGQPAASTNPEDPFAVQKVQRVRPKAKTPMMVAGGVVALGAAGVYGASFATRAKFDAANTTADLERYRGLTNGLVIGAGATLAVGLGIEYAGIILDSQGGGFRIGGRF
jgi:hypothetical protein